MIVRHITAAENVDSDDLLIDALAVCHGAIVAGKVEALAGPIDPATHLNRDFDQHDLSQCVVAEELRVGAAVELTDDGLRLVSAPLSAYLHRGTVDYGARLNDWRLALRERRLAR